MRSKKAVQTTNAVMTIFKLNRAFDRVSSDMRVLLSRAAEDELMTVADEKDKLAPQLEEARWRNRQLEKDVQQLQDTSNATEQVRVSLQFYCA